MTTGIALLSQPIAAQDLMGPQLTFGLSQRFGADDNLDLDVDSLGNSLESLTGLTFGLLSKTPISTLAIDAATNLRYVDGPGSGSNEFDLDGTRFNLAYDRAVANSAVDVSARYSADQIDGLLTLDDFGPGIDLPEDLDVLNGTGIRRAYGLDATLSLGLENPIGYELSAGFSGLSYIDASDPDLYDNQRASAGAALLFHLSPVTTGRVGLDFGEFTSEDPANDDSTNTNLNATLTRELRNGTAAVDLFADEYSEESDSRSGFSLSRAMDLPAGSLEASIGATKLHGDSTVPTGALTWSQELPSGVFDIAASRDVQNNSDNDAQTFTAVQMGYVQELGALSQLDLSLSYALTEGSANDDDTRTARFGATYSRNLTTDWALDMGYTYTQRDEDETGMARSNGIFLDLRRAWELRP